MSKVKASVVVCTHNPRPHFLRRVVGALRGQTLPLDDWELILIDNASSQPLSAIVDLAWHPAGRHVHEAELGLTQSRLRGIAESRAELIIFVDDDNVLQNDYLASALRISAEHDKLGAWGGAINAEFEHQPALSVLPYVGLLAVREVKVDCWSNNRRDISSQPFGAGLCVRRLLAEHYANLCRNEPVSQLLGRRGGGLMAGEDMDLVLTAKPLGLGWGVFTRLQLTHLIPQERLRLSYLLKVSEGISASGALLDYIHDAVVPRDPPAWGMAIRCIKAGIRRGVVAARFEKAQYRGHRKAASIARNWGSRQDVRP